MAVALDHMTVWTSDKLATAEFYQRIFGAHREELRRDFAPVTISGGLTLNLEEAETFKRGHYAFRVAAEEYDAIKERLVAGSVLFGSSTREKNGGEYNHDGRRGFYFDDPNGHGLEVITQS